MIAQSNNLYFKCEWIAQPLQSSGITELLGGMSDRGFYMFVDEISKNPEGYWALYFVVGVPSSQMLDDYVSEVGKKFGLTNWLPLPQNHRKIGPSFTASSMPEFIQNVMKLGQQNEKLKCKSDKK